MLVAWNSIVFLLRSVLPVLVWLVRMWMNIRCDTGCVRALNSASVFIRMENSPGVPPSLQYPGNGGMDVFLYCENWRWVLLDTLLCTKKGVLSFVVYSFNVLRIRICRKTWARIENRNACSKVILSWWNMLVASTIYLCLSIMAMVATERITRWAAKAGRWAIFQGKVARAVL